MDGLIKVCGDPGCEAVWHNILKSHTKRNDCGGRLILINKDTYCNKFSKNYFQYDFLTGSYYRPGKTYCSTSIYGTKCADMPSGFGFKPKTISEVWQEIIEEYGECELNKPIPGDTYRKMYKPLHDMDTLSFKRLPENIIVMTPPRLFRSTGWKYKGRVYLDCELYWQFQYKYRWADGFKTDWTSVYLLSYCYIPQKLSFEFRKQSVQLSLF